MKDAKIKSIFIVMLMMMLSIAAVYAVFTVTPNYPKNQWVPSNTVAFNFTPIANVSTLEWCALSTNKTGTMTLEANYTTGLTNNTAHVAGIGISDSAGMTYNWSIVCSNGYEEIGNHTTFGVDGTPPSITLDAPNDDNYTSNNAGETIKYTPTDASNPDTCWFYTNVTGTWAINQTNSSYTTAKQITVNLSANKGAAVSDGTYIWNALCNDTVRKVWAENTNRTFTIDTLNPSDMRFLYPSNNTFSTDTTPYLVWNQTTDPNFKQYEVFVSTYSNLSNPIQTKIITNRTANYTTLSEIPTDNTYYIYVKATDLAGNSKDSSFIVYTIDSNVPVVTLNAPSNGSYLASATVDFNVTVVDNNPDACELYLSNTSDSTYVLSLNKTEMNVVNGTKLNLTKALSNGGVYFQITCNDSNGNRVNATSTPYFVTVDTISPSIPNISSTWGQTNNTDKTPKLTWTDSTEINFDRYLAQAFYLNNGSVAYEVNVSGRTTNMTNMNLRAGYTYNFSITAYDLAGNSAKSTNTTKTWYYVDEVCGTLNTGWNLCGATWTTNRTLSTIGSETSATFVTLWNSSHEWVTCVYGVSATNCNKNVSISEGAIPTVWIYVNQSTEWRNRTWVSTGASMNLTLSNSTNGWNIIPGVFRNGRLFGDLGRDFTQNNVTMFSMPYNNGTSVPFVNKGLFAGMAANLTRFDYGRAMWVYYNGTGTTTFNVGSW